MVLGDWALNLDPAAFVLCGSDRSSVLWNSVQALFRHWQKWAFLLWTGMRPPKSSGRGGGASVPQLNSVYPAGVWMWSALSPSQRAKGISLLWELCPESEQGAGAPTSGKSTLMCKSAGVRCVQAPFTQLWCSAGFQPLVPECSCVCRWRDVKNGAVWTILWVRLENLP